MLWPIQCPEGALGATHPVDLADPVTDPGSQQAAGVENLLGRSGMGGARRNVIGVGLGLVLACGGGEAMDDATTGSDATDGGADPTSTTLATTMEPTSGMTSATGSEDSSTEGTSEGTSEDPSADDTSTGTGGDRSAPCLPQSAIDAMAEPFSCAVLPIIKAPVEQLPFECHTQGIGLSPSQEHFVVTCQDEGDGDRGRVLSFSVEPDADGEHLALDAVDLLFAADANHPSAIQIDADGRFLVAMAGGNGEPSQLHALAIDDAGQLTELGSPVAHPAGHVGAVAQADALAIGCGWDCATLDVFALADDGTPGLAGHHSTADLVQPGVDENVGAYNSLALVPRCEDDQPLLLASHGDWLDVWSLDDPTASPAITKLAKRQISEDVVQWGNRPIFYEGMTVEITDDELAIWAAPHDFGTDACPDGTRCMQFVYRCTFGG